MNKYESIIIIAQDLEEEGIKKTIAWYFAHEKWMEDVTSGDYQKYYEEMYKGN